MWWKKVKCYLTIAAVAALAIFALSAMACGGLNFHGCKSGGGDGDGDGGGGRLLFENIAFEVRRMLGETGGKTNLLL